MEEGQEKNNIMESKLRTTFAIFVMFVLMAAVAVIFLGIEVPTQQQQQSSQEKKQQESDIESSLPASKLTGLVEELENQGSSFLEKTTKTNESQKEDSVSSHFSELNCDQLSDIVSLFENGWGSALAEFSARCESNDDADIEQQVRSLVK